MIHESGLIGHYENERDGADRIENLNELVNAAAAFAQDEGGIEGDEGEPAAAPDPLNAFLAHAALESGESQAAEGSDAIQLMTVHSAKGLEFHAVFITGLEEGLFPHENSITEDDGLEEERRLMYVALTRARTRAYLSFAQTRLLHGHTRYSVPSRFIDEIPPGVLKWLTPKRRAPINEKAWAAQEPPARYAATRASTSPFRIGQNVVHPKFGQGIIVSAEGAGGDARVQINFGRQGLKWLQLEYAKLAPA